MESLQSPLISIIIPVYNAQPFLDECFQSVADQTFKGPFEVWRSLFTLSVKVSIYNDRSTDDSPQIIEKWLGRFSTLNPNIVSVVVGTNDGSEGKGSFSLFLSIISGCGFAKNKSIAQSNGKFLCFLDADDIMVPERLEELYEAGLSHPNAIIGSNFKRYMSLHTSDSGQNSRRCNDKIY